MLSDLDWNHMLRKRPTWRFEPDKGVLRCPDGQAAKLSCMVRNISRKNHRLIFKTPLVICRRCPIRASCLASTNVDLPKNLSVAVPKVVGDEIAVQLKKVQAARRVERSLREHSRPLPSGRPRKPPVGQPLVVRPPPAAERPGEWQIANAQFRPAAARAAFRTACRDIVVHVTVNRSPADSPHPYLATTPAQRQHRRMTWLERNARYALPNDAELQVVLEGGDRLATVLRLAA